jgi:hypothetical protein
MLARIATPLADPEWDPSGWFSETTHRGTTAFTVLLPLAIILFLIWGLYRLGVLDGVITVVKIFATLVAVFGIFILVDSMFGLGIAADKVSTILHQIASNIHWGDNNT